MESSLVGLVLDVRNGWSMLPSYLVPAKPFFSLI